MNRRSFLTAGIAAGIASPALAAGEQQACAPTRGTGDLGLIIERASGSALIVDVSARKVVSRIEGLGDLSHATAVFGPSERYAYVFGRDGGLTKVDMLGCRIEARVIQAGNAIGGAISDDGALIVASNYTPGGIKVFDANDLTELASVPAIGASGKQSKTVGLVDLPGRRFAYALYDANEIWIADFSAGMTPVLTKFTDVGKLPYDANVTSDARHRRGWFRAYRSVGGDAEGRARLVRLQRRPRKAADLQDAASRRMGAERRQPRPAGGRPARGADPRYRHDEGAGPHRAAQPAGVLRGAAGRARGVDQFRASRQRHGAGARHTHAKNRAHVQAGPRRAASRIHAARA
jgi:hypothetical protein